jgi:hypothetical protein
MKIKYLLLIIVVSLLTNCAPVFEYYTTQPGKPKILENKEIVSIDTINGCKGRSYIYNYKKKEEVK